jgi:hypothetical protein
LFKLVQFIFWHSEVGGATIQADKEIGEYPNNWLVNISQPGEMNAYLRSELAQRG